uniref:50S ribosomal protein L20 n=1 Tax=Chroomonas placoidea TaxID=173977 RepID=A0A222AI79_9CRYP|nr:ribosomal protein L20 [Chroomonas placoidea]ASO76092.1 ribosomal protein L20 [Chroomonas placoidea]
MARVKRGNVARKRRKKILSLAKGFRGSSSKLFRIANQQVMKALRYAYVGRKRKKREFRSLWITRINAAARLEGTNYSSLINTLKVSKVSINRKMLAQIAVSDRGSFTQILKSVSTK